MRLHQDPQTSHSPSSHDAVASIGRLDARGLGPAVDQAPSRPRLGAVLRHVSLALLTATVIPSVLFYVCLVVGSIWLALVVALSWCYGALAWRLGTRRRTSALLWLTVAGLTVKTGIAFASGSTLVYFLQPALSDAVIAVAFLVSLCSARPLVARLAADFYPVDEDLSQRPRVQLLFWRLTALWAAICACKAAISLYLLSSVSTTSYVAAKTVLTPTAALLGAVCTVLLAVQVALREGLLPSRSLAVSRT